MKLIQGWVYLDYIKLIYFKAKSKFKSQFFKSNCQLHLTTTYLFWVFPGNVCFLIEKNWENKNKNKNKNVFNYIYIYKITFSLKLY